MVSVFSELFFFLLRSVYTTENCHCRLETKWWPQGQRDSELCQPLVSLICTPISCPSYTSVSLLFLLTVSIKTICLSQWMLEY